MDFFRRYKNTLFSLGFSILFGGLIIFLGLRSLKFLDTVSEERDVETQRSYSRDVAANRARRFLAQLYPNAQIDVMCANTNTRDNSGRVNCYTVIDTMPGPMVSCPAAINPVRNTECK